MSYCLAIFAFKNNFSKFYSFGTLEIYHLSLFLLHIKIEINIFMLAMTYHCAIFRFINCFATESMNLMVIKRAVSNNQDALETK